eukprot:scaffold1878_cov170-Amphora_coffeaeformis.AAC.21
MAGSKSSITGEDYYGAYDAQDLAKANAERLGVTPVPSLNLVYTAEEDYVTADYAKEKGLEIKKLSGTKFRQMLRGGEDIPEWCVCLQVGCQRLARKRLSGGLSKLKMRKILLICWVGVVAIY